ncbi:NAD-dependent aldehyde dehydrogenase [Rubrobacter radiotolerans]|uniref:Aldehyde dehydrogenase family protein n=1 Tax=Rubrobacter radiotolerans TaxID=42256 RepID=A0A023X416_RUBRA|nr:aldehyde dehydrogenase family protein [Rubrobacter radiotolerans]AHY46946.1 NAD-dependent aldehyde dehydrogenase [Rubrobacter radiotolerans]MDX5894351.1 aldehyde dehydrogenase family protein [Rubrobacter radiotolerans]SMC05802.1 succinate-semialdehyde dehydrogenase / glutarate-semialdehyde dehydrogenase [Rubrobacter radiotolerans DSM 5868]
MAQALINGESVGAKSGEEMPIVNPATEEEFDSVPKGGREDVEAAVAAAKEAFKEWSKTDPDERAAAIRAGVAKVRESAKEVAGLLTKEQGKPFAEAMGELHHFLHGMDYYADLASKIEGIYATLPSNLGPAYGLVIKKPIGVCAGIVPYNFPLTLMGTKVGPALAAGNTIVIKPAATTPLAALRVAELFHEAGLKPGVFNVITGPGAEVGEALATHPDVRRVALTGSTPVGRRLMEVAGPQFKRISAELGGSDPVIVFPDADVDAAVRGINIGRFFNAGQACLAAKRVYVFDEVYDEFMQSLVKRVGRYELGDGSQKAEKPKIRMGPLNAARHRDTLTEQLEDALGRGAKVAIGGEAHEGKGFFFQPTVLENAPHDSRVATEETFGPLLPVFRVSDADEAFRLANESSFGLGSSVYTYDVRMIHRAAQEIEAGMTWVNQLHFGYDELPFGGVKESGIGREHGQEALESYLEQKSVVVGGLG